MSDTCFAPIARDADNAHVRAGRNCRLNGAHAAEWAGARAAIALDCVAPGALVQALLYCGELYGTISFAMLQREASQCKQHPGNYTSGHCRERSAFMVLLVIC